MPIPFTCAECGESYDVDDDMAGKTIKCRECHGFGRVPKSPAHAPHTRTATATSTSPVASPLTPKPEKEELLLHRLPRSRRRLWLPIGLLVLLLGGILGLTGLWFARGPSRKANLLYREACIEQQAGSGTEARARELLNEAIADSPDFAEARALRAEMALRPFPSRNPERLRQAVADAAKAVDLDPGNDRYRLLLRECQSLLANHANSADHP